MLTQSTRASTRFHILGSNKITLFLNELFNSFINLISRGYLCKTILGEARICHTNSLKSSSNVCFTCSTLFCDLARLLLARQDVNLPTYIFLPEKIHRWRVKRLLLSSALTTTVYSFFLHMLVCFVLCQHEVWDLSSSSWVLSLVGEGH